MSNAPSVTPLKTVCRITKSIHMKAVAMRKVIKQLNPPACWLGLKY